MFFDIFAFVVFGVLFAAIVVAMVAEKQLSLRLCRSRPRGLNLRNRSKLCYTFMYVVEAAGIRDLANGEYVPTDKTLEDGIERQNNYLLDQVGCTRPGFRLLEIGCGYGRLLKMAKERGSRAVGVNVSAEQVKYCQDRGLEVHCCTYRDLLDSTEWRGQFDGVIANGSLKHWVQPAQPDLR